MKRAISILFVFITTLGFSQDYKADFDRYFQAGDTVKQLEILKMWEAADPDNAELYTSYFNYYFQMSKQEMLTMTTNMPDGESLSIQDSTGSTAGYLGSQIFYDQEILQKGLNKIDQGIHLFPNRLDMRFGKIYALGQIEEWEQFTEEIVKTIQYSDKNKNRWTWTHNEVQENGENFFLSSIQDYQLTLYNTGNDELLINMRTIAEEVIKYYPNHIESLTNISITYLLNDEYDKGIEALLKAEKVDPTDSIVLTNIAHGYTLKGDSQKAIEYYEKVIKYGDEQTAEFARDRIKELND